MGTTKSTIIAMAVIVGMLAQGSAFKVKVLRELGFSRATVNRVLLSLRREGVIQRANTRKRGMRYMLADGFKDRLKSMVCWKGTVLPGHSLLDICGVEGWTPKELEDYLNDVKGYWMFRYSLKHPRGAP